MSPENDDRAERASSDETDRLERRAFFTEGFRSLIRPLSNIVERRLEHFQKAMDESRRAAFGGSDVRYPHPAAYGASTETRLLRPPGALEEALFLDRCANSAQCVSACPVQAIQLLESDDRRLSGTPFIDPQVQACVVCDDLACMKVCPTGALQSVPRHLIHIGVAEVQQDLCVRTHGEDCRLCVEKCPIGETAIRFADHPADTGEVVVREEGCVGCGVCEMYCPTEPRAIVIKVS